MNKRYFAQIDKLCEGDIIRDGKKEYYADFITFDIETTNIKRLKQSAMYMWSVYINGHCYFGRTWKEFRLMCMHINKTAKAKIVCYVHNFAFEFCYLKSILDFGNDNVFLLDHRKPLKATYGMIEFRCSYMLTNMNLGLFLDTMKVKNPKLKYNYSKYRYSWSKLTWTDYRYSGNDVIGLYQALKKYLALNGDNVITTPLTSTGYVRRDVKQALAENVNNEFMRKIQPSESVLIMLREAFRGGDTHHNRYYYGERVTGVKSRDEKSAYPGVMCQKNFPMTPFVFIGSISQSTLERKIKSNFAILMRVAIYNLRPKNNFNGCPYLSFSKCRNVQNYILDNGRILECDYLETTITDIDYRILMDDFDMDHFIIVEAYQSKYKPLPQCIRDCIMDYFRIKECQTGELRIKAKNKLNSIYGMSVLNPCKPTFKFIDGEVKEQFPEFTEIIEKLIKSKFMPYQWGVWVTCWARYRLHMGRKVLEKHSSEGALDFIYCDTDSIKYIGDHEDDFELLNDQIRKESIETGSYFIDQDGIGHYLGLFEFEGVYSEMVSLGAKKYCYRDQSDGKLHLTLSGVSKSGVKELKNDIRNFKEGFIFTKSAGLTATYNDDVNIYEKIDGHKLHITSNVYLEKTTYKISLSDDYEACIKIAKKLLQNEKETNKIESERKLTQN